VYAIRSQYIADESAVYAVRSQPIAAERSFSVKSRHGYRHTQQVRAVNTAMCTG